MQRWATVLSGYTYSYFLDGNIKSITEADGKTTNYTYDKLGRVTKEEKIDNGTTFVIQYTYDSRGNRASKTENGIRTTYTYDLGNRLTAESSTGKVVTYSYDDNGNRCITYVNNNFAGVYAYDLFNKQISYTANNIGYTYYTYRPDGLRHSVGNNKHVWDGNNITAEKYYSSVTVYVYGIALIKSGTRYYLYSWHGDVIALINLAGSITKTYEYDAFGVEDDIDDSDSNPWRYCGEYYDKETKELYLRARYYDSATGTFTQEDPIKDGNNWYSYCMGNPVVFTDPSGLFSWSNFGKIAAAVAAVVVVTAACAVAASVLLPAAAALVGATIAPTVVSSVVSAGIIGGVASGGVGIVKKTLTGEIDDMTLGEFVGDTAIDSAFGSARGMTQVISPPSLKFAAGATVSYAEGFTRSAISGSTFSEANMQGNAYAKSYVAGEIVGTAIGSFLPTESSLAQEAIYFDDAADVIDDAVQALSNPNVCTATSEIADAILESAAENANKGSGDQKEEQVSKPPKPKEPSKYIKNKMNKIFEDRGLDRPW